MDVHKGLLPLNWTYFHQEKSMDDWRQSVLLNMELEEELRIRDEQIAQLQEMLHVAIKERDEAQEECQNMFFGKILIQHQSAPNSGISSIEEDDPRKGIELSNVFSSSDCDESIVSSPTHLPPAPPQPPPSAGEVIPELPILLDSPLPEKGKLLQAVMKAGPLLQTLLLAGPLPQWRQPPPPLDTNQIPPPPVVIPSSPTPLSTPVSGQSIHQESLQNNNGFKVNRKRGLSENSDCSPIELRYQKGFLQSPLMS